MNILADLAERAILEAQQRGEFENLSGQGQPLAETSDPFMPETLRMAYKVLKNAGYVPREIQSQREIRSYPLAVAAMNWQGPTARAEDTANS